MFAFKTLVALSVLTGSALAESSSPFAVATTTAAVIEPSPTTSANDTSVIFVTGTVVSSSLAASNATITTATYPYNVTAPTASAACSTFVTTVTSCAWSSAFGVSGPVATATIAGNGSWPNATATSVGFLNGITSLSSPNATDSPLAVAGLSKNSAGTNVVQGAAVGVALLGVVAGGLIL